MNSDDYKLYTIEKDRKSVKLKSSQLKTAVLSKVLGLFPDSIILLSKDGYMETADTDCRFHDIDHLPVWTVSGDSLQTHAAPSGGGPGLSGINPYLYQLPVARASKKGRGKSQWTPTYATPMYGLQQPPGVRAQDLSELSSSVPKDGRTETLQRTPPAEWRKSIEVCRWSEQEKVWKKVSNLPIVMTEATANIPRMTKMVADDDFGSEETVLLDIDYLKVPDTSATRGRRMCVALF